MMTQTHSLIAVTLLAKPERPVGQNLAILFGSFIPDAAIYVLFFWSKLNGIPEQELWQKVYFTEPMLTFTAIGNSLPLYCSILIILVVIALIQDKRSQLPINSTVKKTSYWVYASGSAIALFALAAITHLLGDFPVHANDAHPHFWPITDWRFVSPISYWDSNHHGGLFSIIETMIGITLSIIVFRRFKSLVMRLLTGLALLSYIAVPIYFSLTL